ncbi:MAG TPA: hypothetical protein VFE59_37140, partial [Trebonia sp.]|nr:hypothetical protein [Trebonia sp.]
TFPRVLGIECVGTVAASTDPALPDGTTVAAVMGEMGREFNGGYAEYALLPNSLLMPVTTTLPWDVLAALPETCLTAEGSLDALGIGPGCQGRLLIRAGPLRWGWQRRRSLPATASGPRPRPGEKTRPAH